MYQPLPTMLGASRKVFKTLKYIYSRRLLANSPVLLVALSVSLAMAYGTLPPQFPANSSADHGEQQLTTEQTQPTSSVVQASEPMTSSKADTSSTSIEKNVPAEATSEEISLPLQPNPNLNTSGAAPGFGLEPPSNCNTYCAALPPPTSPPYSCGPCQQTNAPKSNTTYPCNDANCMDNP